MKKHGRAARFLVVLMAVVCFAAGCRTSRIKGAHTLDPEEMPFALTERFELGERITDVVFQDVQFRFDSYRVDPPEVPKIEQVAGYMRQNGNVKVVMDGHCDERGSAEYNMSLGERRAQAVRTHLIRLGIASDRLQTRSFGEEKPLDPGHTEDAWRKNRRAEFIPYR